MAVDFPSSPTPGQAYTQGGVTWTWDGVKWVAQGTGTGIYLPLAGGVMTGDITLKGDPSAPLHPVTKQMLDARALAMNDNRIINGDMRIDQRNGGASGTANGYPVDHWLFAGTQASKGTWVRGGPDINAVTPTGFAYYLQFTSSSSYTPLAADYFNFMQAIEADVISDFAFGTVNAKPVTLSFWASTTAPGTYSGTLRNYAGTRSYPFTFSLPVVGFTKVIVNIPGDTGGTWAMGGNAAAMLVGFDLGSGATFRGPANGSWQNGNFIGANGAASIVATNNALLAFTGVKLEVGSVATPFNRQSLAKSLADCQRYYQTGVFDFNAYGAASSAVSTFNSFQPMRVVPTITYSGITYNNCSGATAASLSPSGIKTYVVVGALGGLNATGNFTASAEL